MSEAAGLILCGGKSRRMGRPKAWLPFGDEVLLQRVARRLRSVTPTVIVSTAPGQELPPLPADVVRVADTFAGRGPLQGLHDGLAAAEALGCDRVVAAAVDLPFLEPELARLMLATLGPEDDAVAVRRDGRWEPLLAVYRTRARLTIDRRLADGELAVTTLLKQLRVRRLEAGAWHRADPAGHTFLTLNTTGDYQAALRQAGLEPPK